MLHLRRTHLLVLERDISPALRPPPADLRASAPDLRGLRRRSSPPAPRGAVQSEGRRLVRHRLSLRGEEESPRLGEAGGERREGERREGERREEDRLDLDRHYDRPLDDRVRDRLHAPVVVRLDVVRLDEVGLTITRVPRRARSTAAALPSRTAISRRPLEPTRAPRPPRARSPYVPTSGITRPATRTTAGSAIASAERDVTRLPKRST